MKGFVFNRWISVVSLFVVVAAAYTILTPPDFPLKGLGWVVLATAAVIVSVAVVAGRSTRSIGQMLDDVEHEQTPGVARASALPSGRRGKP